MGTSIVLINIYIYIFIQNSTIIMAHEFPKPAGLQWVEGFGKSAEGDTLKNASGASSVWLTCISSWCMPRRRMMNRLSPRIRGSRSAPCDHFAPGAASPGTIRSTQKQLSTSVGGSAYFELWLVLPFRRVGLLQAETAPGRAGMV